MVNLLVSFWVLRMIIVKINLRSPKGLRIDLGSLRTNDSSYLKIKGTAVDLFIQLKWDGFIYFQWGYSKFACVHLISISDYIIAEIFC